MPLLPLVPLESGGAAAPIGADHVGARRAAHLLDPRSEVLETRRRAVSIRAGSRKPEAGSRKPTWRHGGAMTRRRDEAREWRGDAMTHAMRWLTHAMTRRRDNARDDPATHPVTR
ncbi:hypothetical protein [Streptomyces hygroscopicus]|uniref:hypothetical protein n=1 Tax=Streptomyces hygroscopicus TaxID=1912 RepID=UPI0036AC8C10